MKRFLLFAFSAVTLFHSAFAQSVGERKDRIIASYLIAFGILPQDGETNYWINDPLSSKTVTDLVNEHKKNIRNDVSLTDRAIRNSYQDAFGRAPKSDEYKVWRPLKLSYIELMDKHMKFLRDYPDAFTEVIKLSYRNEFKREAQPQEVNNWRSWGARSYLSIVQEHQKNIRAGMFAVNKLPSNKVLTSKNSGVLFGPSKVVSEEISKFAKSQVISTGGGNVISTGGGNFTANGGNVISTGGGNVISTGGGN